MKAIVTTKFGPPEVLELREVDKPTPKDNEVLVRIHATTVLFGDLYARNVTYQKFAMPAIMYPMIKIMFGFRKPKKTILGAEFSGTVEAIGTDVTLFKKGEEVFGYVADKMGCYAEYRCVPEKATMALKPTNMTHAEAATVPYGVVALALLRKMKIQPGQKILINGASGGIGSTAIQLAKSHFGAEVTGVCGTPRLEFVKSLGADKVIDYTKEDFTQSGETYDLIFDTYNKSSFKKVKHALKKNGRYFLASFGMRQFFQMLWTKLIGSKKIICVMAFDEDIDSLRELANEGKIKAVIDKSFLLEQAAEAHRYVEEGHKKGHIVIQVINQP
ncbi:MAG: NAD(P)-dependent alcohol dehydrogenase [Candidatus Hodarchaeales archaeon]|jgi:NADPH:quinone reductase-like Zn-dependent oxidoreductase